jgi:hypothetical protein
MRILALVATGLVAMLSISVRLTVPPEKNVSAASTPQSDAPCGPHCGTERWSVKTLSDSGAGTVDVTNRITQSVHNLVSLPAPSQLPSDSRIAPTETTTFGVQARLVGFKKETDRDFHIVIADSQTNETMIVEIPDPQCDGVCSSQTKGLISQARQTFVHQCGVPTSQFKKLTSPLLIRITGIGFFDFKHGQTGVAKNAIELHPVLRVELPDSSDFCARHLR